MKKILVCFYGYKSKLLSQAVEQLVNNQSGENNIQVVVYDQTNISRPEKFLDADYSHVYWDNLTSRFTYLNFLKKRKDFDYFMYVDGAKMFNNNWDRELLAASNDIDIILSGNHDIVFNKNNYRFYPEYQKIKINSETKTNWVVKDFFFMTFGLFKTLPDMSMFKYHGAEECLSLFAASKGIPVLAMRTSLFIDEEPNIIEKDFIPFAIYNNYSKIIDAFKKKDGSIDGVDKLMDIIDYDFSSLEYFPYPVNDIEYSLSTNLDKMSERRFHQVQKSIY